MTAKRVRAAVLISSALVLTSLAGTACSGSDGAQGTLPDTGTQAPNSPPGTIPDVITTLPTGTLPPPSGNGSACAEAPYDLSVRSASGEERTVTERSSWAMYAPGAAPWVIATGDVDLPADRVRTSLPDPAGKTLVLLRLLSPTPSTMTLPLAAGDRFEPIGSSAPNGKPVVDAQVRTAAGQAPTTAPLTGSVTVDAVTSQGVCLSVDLSRDGGARIKGRVAAPFLSVNESVLTP